MTVMKLMKLAGFMRLPRLMRLIESIGVNVKEEGGWRWKLCDLANTVEKEIIRK